ncbi:MAG: cis-3-alkyl-4-acyloxetan-2-one decarboxylase [Thermoleophilaceae bacterium]|nr:cis-3-alkyl-4-acyloxetan-2-one decarboxylase [Thermoleophilaceae bacterium]
MLAEDRTGSWEFGGTWPFEPHFHGAEGDRLHYVDEGPRAGRPVVLLHGNPAWSYLYRRFLPALSDAGHRAIAVDLLGFGRSDKPADAAAYSVESHAARVAALLDELDLRDACLVVHDWGGPIGLGWAGENPDRVSRLMILNTFAPRLPGPMGRAFTLRVLRARGVGELIATVRDGLTEDFLLRAGVRDRGAFDAHAKEAYRAPHPDRASRTGILAFPRQVPLSPDTAVAELTRRTEGLLRLHFRDRGARICWGMHDVLFREPVLELWRDLLPQAGVVKLAEAGHFVQEDAPERVIAELLALLGE